MSDNLKAWMQECGFWQRYQIDDLSPVVAISLAKMHHYCVDPAHKQKMEIKNVKND